jgi:LAO/AO transport system kinase
MKKAILSSHRRILSKAITLITGAGDDLQGIKKGIPELADAVVINKADGDNLIKAENARKGLETILHLMQPATLTCTGLKTIWQTVQEYHQRISAAGELQIKRKNQALEWMWAMVEEGLKEWYHRHPAVRSQLDRTVARVRQGDLGLATAVRELLFFLDNQ